MSQEKKVDEPPALGTFLRDHRQQKGVTLNEVTEVTKISKNILEAIERDDYKSLPAETFSRGFYSLYADFLGLNPEEILARYLESRGQKPPSRQDQVRPPLKNSKKFSTFAEPASFSFASTINIIIVALLMAVAAICWSLNWNPATYISAKLQSLKGRSVTAEKRLPGSPGREEPPTEAQPAAH